MVESQPVDNNEFEELVAAVKEGAPGRKQVDAQSVDTRLKLYAYGK